MSAVAPPVAREIRGPSAFGGGLRRFVNLTWMIASTDFRVTYFGSVLGYLWSLMRPLLTFAVMYVVFNQFARLGHGVAHYPLLLLLNIVLITFFQEATGLAVASVINRENLVRKMHFPRMVIPLATVLTASFNLVLNLLAVFVFMIASGISAHWTWLLLPPLLAVLIGLTAGVSMMLSSLYVRYRDVAMIWSVISQALFYGSLVFVTIERVPHGLRRLVLCNPLAAILEQARHWIIDPGAPSISRAMGGFQWALIPIGLVIVLCVLGLWIFERQAPQIAERL